MTGMFTGEAQVYEWIGTNSRGQGTGGRGAIGRTLELWVKRKFDLGWPKLEVRRLGETEPVALVGTAPDGRRTWWAES